MMVVRSMLMVPCLHQARDVVAVLKQHQHAARINEERTWIQTVDIFDAGYAAVVGTYVLGGGMETVPAGFAAVCTANDWQV